MSSERLIFIVDDDAMYSQMLADHLAADPRNKVVSFSTGDECLRQLHQSPDFVILDYHLNLVEKEAKNGIEILEQIRKKNQHARIVMLSGQERYGVALQTISKGADHYVVKDTAAFENLDRFIGS